MFSAAHTTRGAEYSNILSTSGPINESTLTEAVILASRMIDPKGEIADIRAISLFASSEQFSELRKSLYSILEPATSNNAINVVSREVPSGLMGLLPGGGDVTPYFNGGDWWVSTDVREGLVLQMREDPRLEEDFAQSTYDTKLSSILRYAIGMVDPRSLIGVKGS